MSGSRRARAWRVAGAVLVLVGGAVHLWLLAEGYGPHRISVAFAANAIVAAIIGGYLVVRRDVLGPIAGLAYALASLAALVAARTGDGVLGFREQGLRPMPELAIALAAEALGAIALIGGIRTQDPYGRSARIRR